MYQKLPQKILPILLLLSSLVLGTHSVMWQGQYYIGITPQVGTYPFNFTVFDDPINGSICFSDQQNLVTDSLGVWRTEVNDTSIACNNASKDYYLEMSINGIIQPPRRLLHTTFDYLRRDTADTLTGTLNVTDNITAAHYFGDGSMLIGVVTNITTTTPIIGGPITSIGTIGITKANISTDGYLAGADFSIFNNKAGTGSCTGTNAVQTTTTGGVTCLNTRTQISGTAPVSYDSGTGIISMAKSTTSVNGYLASTDFTTFNGKAAPGTCSTGQVVQNTTTTGVQCTTLVAPIPNMPIGFGTMTGPDCSVGGITTYISTGAGSSTTEASVIKYIAPKLNNFNSLYIKLGGNVPASQSAVFAVMKNGVAQTLTCTVSAGTSTCSDTTHSFSTSIGDIIDVRLICSGGTTALTPSVSVTTTAQ